MVNIFFNKKGELKKWVTLFFTLLVPFFFSIWGILLSVKSLNLSRETNKNRDQINALTDMVKELKQQNTLLQQSVSLQDTQFKVYISEIKYAKRPFLKANVGGGDVSDVANMFVDISNSGGDVLNLSWTSIKGAKVDSGSIPINKMIATGATHTFRISNLTNGSGIRFTFRDRDLNKYSQDIIWNTENQNLQFGILRELK